MAAIICTIRDAGGGDVPLSVTITAGGIDAAGQWVTQHLIEGSDGRRLPRVVGKVTQPGPVVGTNSAPVTLVPSGPGWGYRATVRGANVNLTLYFEVSPGATTVDLADAIDVPPAELTAVASVLDRVSALETGAHQPGVQALPASILTDYAGVNTHTSYTDTSYGDAARLATLITDLGVRHLREELDPNAAWQQPIKAALAAATGARFTLIAHKAEADAAGKVPADYLAAVDALGPDVVEAIEGMNEPDRLGGNWVTTARTWQTGLAAAVAASARPDLPLLAPSVAALWKQRELGDLRDSSTVGNGHLYPGGREPEYDADGRVSGMRRSLLARPQIVTEAGYHNAAASTATTADGHPYIPEAEAAIYLPRLLLTYLRRGVQRLFLYELLDTFPPTGNEANAEAHFGLVRYDGTPKPAYHAVRRLLALADTGTTTPGSLAYTVAMEPDAAGQTYEQLLLQRADGTFLLCIWRPRAIWSADGHVPWPLDPEPVTITLPSPATVTLHRPSVADAGTPLGITDTIDATLGADVHIYAIQAGSNG